MEDIVVKKNNNDNSSSNIDEIKLEKEIDVSKTSLATALFACLTLALAGYLSFFQFVQADVLNNFGGTAAITLARILLAVTMILTYPMSNNGFSTILPMWYIPFICTKYECIHL